MIKYTVEGNMEDPPGMNRRRIIHNLEELVANNDHRVSPAVHAYGGTMTTERSSSPLMQRK